MIIKLFFLFSSIRDKHRQYTFDGLAEVILTFVVEMWVSERDAGWSLNSYSPILCPLSSSVLTLKSK